MKFNEKLIELRKKQGLSQEELGYKLNVTRQTVSKWELGQTTPEMDKLVEISKMFNISVDELVNETETNINLNNTIEDKPIEEKNTREKSIKFVLIGVLLIVFVLMAIKVFSGFSFFNQLIGNSKDIKENTESIFDKVFGLVDKTIENQENIMGNTGSIIENANNEINITKFNGGLQIYNGGQKGTNVKSLIDNVITSNKTKDRKITVIFLETKTQDPEEIKNLKVSIGDYNNYEVSFEYDEEGYISEVKFERVITQYEVSSFNSSIEIYTGTKLGGTVKTALDAIVKSNRTEERKITVKYMDIETQDETEIRNMKKNIDHFDDFELYFEYDAYGFIYKAIIEKL